MQTYRTIDRHGYSARFSPLDPDVLLVATSQLYGLAGGGTLFMLKQQTEYQKNITELQRFEWSDGLFDVSWCPYTSSIAATASGDGSLQIWGDLNTDSATDLETIGKPKLCLQEHKNEVYSIDWGEEWNYHHLLSASWDGSIKLWDCNRLNSISTFVGHTDLIYCAKYSPLIANLFASVSHTSELLALDWNQFDRNGLVTGDADGTIRFWDLRNMRHEVLQLLSGEFAVRRLACSPISSSVLASANYDFTTRIWDISKSTQALEVLNHHSEFVCGLDWNINYPHQLTDCGWDATVNIFMPQSLIGVHNK